MDRLTPRQRDTLLKITINASNAVLGGIVLGSVLGESFHIRTFIAGLGIYVLLIWIALQVER